MSRLLAALALAAMSCGSHDPPRAERTNSERQTRVIEPPADKVRPLPPHAIRGDGVGPYRLGTPLGQLAEQLPSGPRITMLDVPGVVHRSLLRADDDAILIGGEPLGRADYVAVVGGDVARTESGIHVGSTRDELVRALGPPADDAERAHDPRIIVPSGLRNARVVLDGDRVQAIVVLAEPPAPHPTPAAEGCTRPVVDPPRFGACLWASGQVGSVEGDELVLRLADSDKAFGLPIPVRGLAFAAALRNPEGRDDLVAVARIDDGQVRTWTLVAYRFDGKRFVPAIEPTAVYQLSAAHAHWLGAELKDVELYLELQARPEAIEVGGLLTTRSGDRLRYVALISPFSVPRHRNKPPPTEPQDAGVSDAR